MELCTLPDVATVTPLPTETPTTTPTPGPTLTPTPATCSEMVTIRNYRAPIWSDGGYSDSYSVTGNFGSANSVLPSVW